jgi:hypothetical protein
LKLTDRDYNNNGMSDLLALKFCWFEYKYVQCFCSTPLLDGQEESQIRMMPIGLNAPILPQKSNPF